ncbi:peptidoglycan-binding protein [Luteibacter sp. NPDC031894]|uniref:peptidoglycan-binding protein n=1 Tax=Luteibacter sp. NPDC031894 TaxID=3390572 RepID=UPI003CFC99D9
MGRDGLLHDGVRANPVTPADHGWYAAAGSELAAFSVPRMFDTANPHARLFVANFDGTGNDVVSDREHVTNVGTLHLQLEELGRNEPRVWSRYVEGPGTQQGFVARTWDGVTGRTYDKRIEEMYHLLLDKAREWKGEDPDADIRVITTGFSRGAEQAAGFARLVHERGIQDPEGLRVKERTPGRDTTQWTLPPLVPPGKTLITEVLYDPVGTGRPHDRNRTPPPSVVSGLQIVARDERRNAFPSSQILPQGRSGDGRFLGVTVPGSHSDIGGSYHLDGLAVLNFNLVADFINAHSDIPLVTKQPEPADPRHYVIHRSEDHLMVYRTTRFEREGVRDELGSQVSPPHCRLVEICPPPEPFDSSLAPLVGQRHPVSIGPLPPDRAADVAFDRPMQDSALDTHWGASRDPIMAPPPMARRTSMLEEPPFTPLRLDPVPMAPEVEARALRHGMHGEDVSTLQAQLAQLGYTDTRGRPLPADGRFGDLTHAAVDLFQREHDLAPDGIAGPRTQAAISEDVRQRAPTHSRAEPAMPPLAALDRNDPRHSDAPQHDLYSALQERVPDASENRLLQFTAACHEHRINARNLGDIHLDEANLTISFHGQGWLATPASVDLKVPSPEPEASIQHLHQTDAWQQQISQDIAQSAQMSMGHSR